MKPSILAFALALGLATPAVAQAPEARVLERLHYADANKDGVVSRAEFTQRRASEFARFDRNQDGVIAVDDAPRFAARRPIGWSMDSTIAAFDRDGDGKVSASEFNTGPTPVFDRVDTNRDDHLTRTEIAAAQAAPHSPR